MHRLVMKSAAYRQGSQADSQTQVSDPENLLWSRMPVRRVDAEVLHDAVLRVTGRLNPTPFGPPAEVEVKPDGEVVAKSAKAGYRRGLYVLQRRITPITLLDVFDLPAMSPNCIERRQSTVPTQALQMMNSETLKQLCRFLAGRLIDEFPENPRRQIEQVYLRALSRYPSENEVQLGMEGLSELAKHWTSYADAEKLEAPKMYTAKWRALADFCQTIIGSAEFSYVD